MKIILTEKVPCLGNVGEIVNVSSGHARNYLVPRKLAVLADESNQKRLDDNKRRLQKKIDDQKNLAVELKGKIDGLKFDLIKKVGGNGKLFGSVTNAELANEIEKKHGIVIERRLIVIEESIKNLGTYDIKTKIFQDVEASFQVNVVMDPKQAKEMKEKQIQSEKRAIERKAKAALEKEKAETEGEEGSSDVEGEEAEESVE